MKSDFIIRLIQDSDADEVLAIYKYYVDHTAISFEYDAPTKEEYIERIKTNTERYPWLVCLYENKIIGFAYGSTHRYRTAYQWSPEATIYIDHQFQSKGLGKILYQTLFDLLKLQGYCNVFAGVALPNEKSVALHLSLGFEVIGIFKNVGFKHGQWHSTQWFQLNLDPLNTNPHVPYKVKELQETKTFLTVFKNAQEKLKQ